MRVRDALASEQSYSACCAINFSLPNAYSDVIERRSGHSARTAMSFWGKSTCCQQFLWWGPPCDGCDSKKRIVRSPPVPYADWPK